MWQEKFKVLKDVFDLYTERNLFHMQSQGHFDGLESPIGVGKEANTFSATRGKGRVLVKIYRLSTCDFNRMYDNIRADPRFENLRHHPRKVVFAWAKREAMNLVKLHYAKVRVPMLIAVRDNILIMDFVGDPAPQLKKQPPQEPKKFFEQVVRQMCLMAKAGFVHGDLSPYNILNCEEKPVIIDVSQATTFLHPHAQDLLNRDVRNICTYFRKLAVEADEEQLTQRIRSVLKQRSTRKKYG